ncbi:MAG: hypothetical protein JWM82_2104 [Myxococcales bacterium]|nr:hypothetical protein [Myxococcales bacterium]
MRAWAETALRVAPQRARRSPGPPRGSPSAGRPRRVAARRPIERSMRVPLVCSTLTLRGRQTVGAREDRSARPRRHRSSLLRSCAEPRNVGTMRPLTPATLIAVLLVVCAGCRRSDAKADVDASAPYMFPVDSVDRANAICARLSTAGVAKSCTTATEKKADWTFAHFQPVGGFPKDQCTVTVYFSDKSFPRRRRGAESESRRGRQLPRHRRALAGDQDVDELRDERHV